MRLRVLLALIIHITHALVPQKFLKSTFVSKTKLNMDIPLVPALIGTAVVVFGIFNIPENPIDLTDQGRAKAAMKRRQEKLARGESIEKDPSLDPYRWKIFEDDVDEIDMLGGKKGGGCG